MQQVQTSAVAGASLGPEDLRLASYDYELPLDAVAQRPAGQRDDARLMVVHAGEAVHRRFREIGRFLRAGDVVVFNDARVEPARLRGHKESGGAVEALLLRAEGGDRHVALVRASRRPGVGARLRFDRGLVATVAADLGDGRCRLCFSGPGDVGRLVRSVAELPLPPYIHRPGGPDAADLDRYQTVYAREPGSVAAPTAGLHFTPALMRELTLQGVRVAFLTLHVGPATFQPLRSEDLSRHSLEGEAYTIPGETVDAIREARVTGGRVVAVGTTTTRALESAGEGGAILQAGAGVATLFIRPGHRFRVVDGLITNFHLPRSSLLVLVAAFLGRRRLLAAYAEALARGYRFYSYGDAMAAFAPGGAAERRPPWSP